MYVLINRETLAICHKHGDRGTVSLLGKIEVSHSKALVLPVDERAFLELTEMEIRILHSHVTGEKIAGTVFHSLLKDLLRVIALLPDSDVNAYEVAQQANSIPFLDTDFYKYVRGSTRPLKLEELFEPEPITVRTVAPVKPAQQPLKTVQAPHQNPGQLPSWHPLYINPSNTSLGL